MSYRLIPSKRFIKAAKKYKRSGRLHVLETAEEVIKLLVTHDRSSLIILADMWRDHPLKGDKAGIRELHLGFDDLLLYKVDIEGRVIELLDIVSHDELSKW